MEVASSPGRIDHALSVLSSFKNMQEKDFICDFNIQVAQKTVPVHRALIAASSEYFRAMFSHNTLELQQGFVHMKDMDITAINHCVSYMYTGEAAVNDQDIKNVLFASEMFQLHGLTDLCFQYLQENLSSDNCLYVRHLSTTYSQKEVSQLAENVAIRKFKDVILGDFFPMISVDELISYIKAANENYEVYWKAAMLWIKGNQQNLDQCLFRLMRASNFLAACPVDFLLKTALREEIIQQCESARKYIIDTIFSNIKSKTSCITCENYFALASLERNSTIGDDSVKEKLIAFLETNLEELGRDDQYRSISFDVVRRVLTSCNAKCSEVVKYQLAVKWVRHDVRERKCYFPQLFRSLQLENLPFAVIRSSVRAEQLVKESPECMSMLYELSNHEASYDEIEKEGKRHAIQSFQSKVDTEDFKGIAKEDVLWFIKSQSSNFEASCDVMFKWLENKKENEKVLFLELLKATDFAQLPYHLKLKKVTEKVDALKSETMKDLIVSSLFSEGEKLVGHITLHNWFALKALNDNHNKLNKEEIASILIDYFTEHLQKGIEMENFKRLENQYLLRIFESPKCSEAELLKWRAAVKWMQANYETRKDQFPDLVEFVNVEKLSFVELLNGIWNEEVVQKSIKVRTKVVNALFNDLKRIESRLNFENCFALKIVNETYNENRKNQVKAIIYDFMMANLRNVMLDQQFALLTSDDMQNMLTSRLAGTQHELLKLEAVLIWMESNGCSETLVACLRSGIDFSEISFNDFLGKIRKSPVARASERLIQFIASDLLSDMLRVQHIDIENVMFLWKLSEATQNPEKFKKSITACVFSDVDKIKNALDIETFFIFWSMISIDRKDRAMAVLMSFMTRNLDAILKSKKFVTLSLQEIYLLFNSVKIGYTWKNVQQWVSYKKGREKFIDRFLQFFTIDRFSIKYIMDNVWIDENVQKFDKAKLLFVKSVFNDLKQLNRNLRLDNCFALKKLNDQHDTEHTTEAAAVLNTYFVKNFLEITAMQEWKDLRKGDNTAFDSQTPTSSLENEKMKALITWAKGSVRSLSTLPKLLKQFDYSQISLELIKNLLWTEYIRKTPENMKVLREMLDAKRSVNPCLTKYDTVLTTFNCATNNAYDIKGHSGIHFRGVINLDEVIFLISSECIFRLDDKLNWKNVTACQNWISLSAMLVAFQSLIYVVDLNKMAAYDPFLNRWIPHPQAPDVADGFFVTSSDTFLFVMGGSDRAKKFDPSEEKWIEIADMNSKRCDGAAATLGDNVYVMGGWWLLQTLRSVECYDPATNSWAVVSSMSVSRVKFNACSIGGKIFALGGIRSKNQWADEKLSTDVTEVYDERSRKWEVLPSVKIASDGTNCCVGPIQLGTKNLMTLDLREKLIENKFTENSEREVSTAVETNSGGSNCCVESAQLDTQNVSSSDLSKEFEMIKVTGGNGGEVVPSVKTSSNGASCNLESVQLGTENMTTLEVLHLLQTELRTKHTVSKSIGSNGGEITAYGSKIYFSPHLLRKETTIFFSVYEDENFSLESFIPVSPIIECLPSMSFCFPVKSEIETWFTADDDARLRGYLLSGERGGWYSEKVYWVKEKGKINLGLNHFSLKRLVIKAADVMRGKYRLMNDLYIHRGTAQIIATFCKDGRSRHFIESILIKRGFAALPIKPFEIRKKAGQIIRPEITFTHPKQATALSTTTFKVELELFRSKEYEVYFEPLAWAMNYEGMIKGRYTVKDNAGDIIVPIDVMWPIPTNTPVGPTFHITANQLALAGGSITNKGTTNIMDN